MFRYNFYLPTLIVCVVLLVSACSNSNRGYELGALQTTKLGVTYSAALTGIDSDNIAYSGSITIENKTTVMLDGVLVTPRDIVIDLNAGDIVISLTGTSYIDENGNLTSIVIHNSGTICTPASPDRLPSKLKIGESGVRSTLTCSNNTTNEASWNTDVTGNNEIELTSTSLIKDQFNEIISVNNITFIIDGGGNIVSFNATSTHSASDYMLAYQSL